MMDEEKTGRIGIFEYDWSVYGFIKDFVIQLAEAGYTVDVFQKDPNVKLDFTDPGQFSQYPNVRYLNFTTSNKLPQRILRKFSGLLSRLSRDYRQNPKSFLDSEVLLRSKQIVSESTYQCFIGVEKIGLIWAGILSQMYGYPLIYYSLELYIEDHPGAQGYSYLRKAEKQYHRLSGATIIQDKLRAKALLEANEIATTNLIYFPISTSGAIVEKKSSFFHQKCRIQETKRFLLYFGQIQEQRFSTDLVRIADRLKDDMVLVLHGFGDQAYLAYLQSIADLNRVIFSFDFLPEEGILDVISSAAIGLALYQNTSSNDRLAAFSSVKVAYYLQCGVPIIAFESESFRELMNTYQCGELIRSIDEIPQKVERILRDYDCYRQQAFQAFRQFYDFDHNFRKFIVDFGDFIKNKP